MHFHDHSVWYKLYGIRCCLEPCPLSVISNNWVSGEEFQVSACLSQAGNGISHIQYQIPPYWYTAWNLLLTQKIPTLHKAPITTTKELYILMSNFEFTLAIALGWGPESRHTGYAHSHSPKLHTRTHYKLGGTDTNHSMLCRSTGYIINCTGKC